VAASRLPGSFVECGCFLGGMGIFMGLASEAFGLDRVRIHLFDSFEGFPPGETDVMLGRSIQGPTFADIEPIVRANIEHELGSARRFIFHRGYVEDTLPDFDCPKLSLLRLDTDFYNSTRIELELLYPHLVPGGALIVDDYGFFQGARQATDEYFAGAEQPPLLNRIDQGVWAGVKPG
jgi:O-methyltransferase